MTPEIEWNDNPHTQTQPHSADLRRCPPGGLPPAIILMDWITGNELHWWNGRSFPHLKTECPACAAKRAKVWKGYVACLDPKTRKIFILELTPNCTEPLSAYKLTFGSLRGATIKLDRPATKINGRVTATVTPTHLGGLELPQPPDVRKILQHMWQTDHRPADDQPQVPRPIVESPMSNEELERRNPERFRTDGNSGTKVYQATEATKAALQRNREAAATTPKSNGKPEHK